MYGILAITVDVEGISVIELKSNETDYSYAHYYQVEFAAENGSALRPHIIGAVDQTILDNESVFSTTSVLLQALTETNDFATFVPGTTYYMVVPPHVYSQGATFNASSTFFITLDIGNSMSFQASVERPVYWMSPPVNQSNLP